jgi:PEP-CTERM motif
MMLRYSVWILAAGLVAIAGRNACGAVIASDNASDPAYADGWTNGDNGGTGFGPWSGVGSYGPEPVMEIDSAPAESDNDLGSPAFRIGTGGIFGGYVVERTIQSPMQGGQKFTMDYDSYPITEAGMPRDILIKFSSAGGERLGLYGYYYNDGTYVFGSDDWELNADTANDNLNGGTSLSPGLISDWGTGYSATDGSDGFSLILDLPTIDTYRLRIVDDSVTRVDVSGQLYSGASVVGQGISKITFYGSETSNQFPDMGGVAYFNNLQIESTAVAGLLGDYNNNGKIDAADYSVWRDALAAGSTSLTNDSTPGIVNESDFTYWRNHYGEMAMGGGASRGAAAIPEPGTAILVAAAVLCCFGCRRRRD